MINMMKNFFPVPTGNNTVEKFRNNILQSQVRSTPRLSMPVDHAGLLHQLWGWTLQKRKNRVPHDGNHVCGSPVRWHSVGTGSWMISGRLPLGLLSSGTTWDGRLSTTWVLICCCSIIPLVKDTYENVIPSVYTDDDTMVLYALWPLLRWPSYIISDTYAGPASINVTAYTWDGELISNNVYSGKVERGSAQMIYQIKQSLFCGM